ncbi:hypothetical protein TNCV_4049241 [Trichonephila clavipes]|nr:hypothetical protein TNCV_4049241 [Trichonephila clavipes]
MLKHLRFGIFELEETNLPERLINATNERRLVQGHQTPLRGKADIEVFSVNWTIRVTGWTFWMKHPEFHCSRRDRHLIKPVQD